jgi:hypothetical protein
MSNNKESFWDLINTDSDDNKTVIYTAYGTEEKIQQLTGLLNEVRGDSDSEITYDSAE